MTLQLARFAVAGAGLWLLLLVIRRPIRLAWRHLPLLAALVGLSGGASYGYMTSVRYIPVPVASLVFFTFPLMVAPLAHLLGDERLTAGRLLAMAVGFAGIVLVLEGGIGHADPRGLAMAFGAGTCVAFRSEEHTSELQSLMRISYAVFCLKKKKKKNHKKLQNDDKLKKTTIVRKDT